MRQGLSDLQGRILVGIYERSLDYHQHPHVWPWSQGVNWGSPHGATRAEQASHSRALARLEGYGLIKRLNWASGKRRTTHVQIRAAGIVMAEQLTNKRGVWMLTIGTRSVPAHHVMTDEEYTQEMERIRREHLH